MGNIYLESIKKQFEYYKLLGEKTFEQINDEHVNWQYNGESNSIATVVKHMSGNMISRWTDFLTTDGEKSWRNREAEFENNISTKAELINIWNKGWDCFFTTINALTTEDLTKEIFIRNQGQKVIDAINRQLAHYPYHVGQIVFIGKMIANENWKSLSIPKGDSAKYNKEKFDKPKQTAHFTDEYLDKNK